MILFIVVRAVTRHLNVNIRIGLSGQFMRPREHVEINEPEVAAMDCTRSGLSDDKLAKAAPHCLPPTDNGVCSICIENMDGVESTREVALCGHAFHSLCLKKWLHRVNTCPNCQRAALEDDNNQKEVTRYNSFTDRLHPSSSTWELR